MTTSPPSSTPSSTPPASPLPPASPSPSGWNPNRNSCLGIAIGGFLGLLVVFLAITVWARQGKLPDVDRQIHAREFKAWESVAPASYDIETRVTGRQPALYIVQVRNHQVLTATRNGTPLQQRRTMGTWSVPGMFDTMESDLLNESDNQDERLMSNSPQVTVRARFDPDWHYPEKYQRIEWGTHYEVEWEVTKFTVIDDPIVAPAADSHNRSSPSAN